MGIEPISKVLRMLRSNELIEQCLLVVGRQVIAQVGVMVQGEGTAQMNMRKREMVVAVTGKNTVMCECPNARKQKGVIC